MIVHRFGCMLAHVQVCIYVIDMCYVWVYVCIDRGTIAEHLGIHLFPA